MSDQNVEITAKIRFEQAPAMHLYNSIRDTARARFVAARRLSSRDFRIMRIASFASGFLIINSILPNFFIRPAEFTNTLSLVSVLLSIVVLISSLLQFSRVDSVAAEQHHRSGLELNELHRRMAFMAPKLTEVQYDDLVRCYNLVLQKYSINHDMVDYLEVVLDRPHENPWLNGWAKAWSRIKVWWTGRVADLTLVLVLCIGLYTAGWYIVGDNEGPNVQRVEAAGQQDSNISK